MSSRNGYEENLGPSHLGRGVEVTAENSLFGLLHSWFSPAPVANTSSPLPSFHLQPSRSGSTLASRRTTQHSTIPVSYAAQVCQHLADPQPSACATAQQPDRGASPPSPSGALQQPNSVCQDEKGRLTPSFCEGHMEHQGQQQQHNMLLHNIQELVNHTEAQADAVLDGVCTLTGAVHNIRQADAARLQEAEGRAQILAGSLAATESQLASVRQECDRVVGSLQSEVKELKVAAADAAARQTRLKADHDDMASQLSRLHKALQQAASGQAAALDRCASAEARSSSAQHQLDATLQDLVDRLASQNATLTQQAATLQARCGALQAEAHQLEAALEQAKQRTPEACESLSAQYEQQVREMISQHNASVTQKKAAHAETISALKAKHDQALQELLQQHAQQTELLKLQHQQQVHGTVQGLQHAHQQEFQQQQQTHQQMLQHLQTVQQHMIDSYQQELAQIKHQHQAQTRLLAQHHEEEQARLKQQHMAMMQASQEQHLQQLSDLQAAHAAEVTALHAQLHAAKDLAQQWSVRLSEEVAAASRLQAQVAALAAECDQCRQCATQVEVLAAAVSAQVSGQQVQISELQAQAMAQQQLAEQHGAEVQHLKAKCIGAHEQSAQLLHLLDLAEQQDCATSGLKRELLAGYQALVDRLRSQVAAQQAEAAECGRVLKRGRAASVGFYTAPHTPLRAGGTAGSTGAGEDVLMVSGDDGEWTADLQATVLTMQGELSRVQQECESRQSLSAQLQAVLCQLDLTHSELQLEHSRVLGELGVAHSDVTRLRNQTTALSEQLHQARGQLSAQEAAHAQQLHQLQEELKQLKAELQQVQQQHMREHDKLANGCTASHNGVNEKGEAGWAGSAQGGMPTTICSTASTSPPSQGQDPPGVPAVVEAERRRADSVGSRLSSLQAHHSETLSKLHKLQQAHQTLQGEHVALHGQYTRVQSRHKEVVAEKERLGEQLRQALATLAELQGTQQLSATTSSEVLAPPALTSSTHGFKEGSLQSFVAAATNPAPPQGNSHKQAMNLPTLQPVTARRAATAPAPDLSTSSAGTPSPTTAQQPVPRSRAAAAAAAAARVHRAHDSPGMAARTTTSSVAGLSPTYRSRQAAHTSGLSPIQQSSTQPQASGRQGDMQGSSHDAVGAAQRLAQLQEGLRSRLEERRPLAMDGRGPCDVAMGNGRSRGTRSDDGQATECGNPQPSSSPQQLTGAIMYRGGHHGAAFMINNPLPLVGHDSSGTSEASDAGGRQILPLEKTEAGAPVLNGVLRRGTRQTLSEAGAGTVYPVHDSSRAQLWDTNSQMLEIHSSRAADHADPEHSGGGPAPHDSNPLPPQAASNGKGSPSVIRILDNALAMEEEREQAASELAAAVVAALDAAVATVASPPPSTPGTHPRGSASGLNHRVTSSSGVLVDSPGSASPCAGRAASHRPSVSGLTMQGRPQGVLSASSTKDAPAVRGCEATATPEEPKAMPSRACEGSGGSSATSGDLLSRISEDTVLAGVGAGRGSIVYSHKQPSDSEEGHDGDRPRSTAARRGGIGFFTNPLAARRALSPALNAAGQLGDAVVAAGGGGGGAGVEGGEGLEQWEVEECEEEDEEVGAVVVMPGTSP